MVYTDSWYNDDALDDLDEHTINMQTVFVGGFRLLQQRGGEGGGSNCYDSVVWDPIQPRCLDYEEDQTTFGPPSGRAKETGGFDHRCDPADEDMCGFYVDFAIGNHTRAEQVTRLNTLKSARWLDDQTRYLYIDTSMYNNNFKLWVRVALVLHFDLAGDTFESEQIEVLHVDPYPFESDDIDIPDVPLTMGRMLLEIVFIVLYIREVRQEVNEFRSAHSFRDYMNQYGWMNNLGDWLSIIANGTIIAFWIVLVSLRQRRDLVAMGDGTADFDAYFDLGTLAVWDEQYVGVNAANIVIQTFRALRFFQVLYQGERLTHSLNKMAPELISFAPIFFVVMFGYCVAGTIFFGMSDKSWATLGEAMFNMWAMNFGLYDTTQHVGASTGVTMFIYSSIIVISIIMMNIFLAIVLSGWQGLDELDEQHEYLIPVKQTLWGHDVPMVLYIPTKTITEVINRMPELLETGGSAELTPTDLDNLLKRALGSNSAVADRQAKIIASWFWEAPSQEDLLRSEPSDGSYKPATEKKKRRHRRHISAASDDRPPTPRDDGAKPRLWLVKQLQRMRQRRVWVSELAHFLLFLFVYVLAIYRERSTKDCHSLHLLVEDILVSATNNAGTDFDGIQTFDDVFTWTEEAFVPLVYADSWYNGDAFDLIDLHTLGPGHTRMVGGWRILQTRGQENTTDCYVGRFERIRPVCVTHDVDTQAYGPGVNGSVAGPGDDVDTFAQIQGAFQYRCETPFGRDEDDSADCGFSVHGPFQNSTGLVTAALQKLQMLKKYRWLDRQTQSLRLGLTLYSSSLKRWGSVELDLDFTLAGGIRPSHSIAVLHLDPYDADLSGEQVWNIILQILFLFCVLLYVYESFMKGRHLRTPIGRARFQSITLTTVNRYLLELVCLGLNLAVVIQWLKLLNMDFNSLTDYALTGDTKTSDEPGGRYPDVTAAVDWELSWRSLNGLNLIAQTLRGVAYFQLTKSGSRLIQALNRAAPQLLLFMPIYCVVLCGFAFSGHLMFGIRDGDWSYFSYAFYNVFEMQLNLYSAYTVYGLSTWSVVWIYSLMLLSTVVLTNVFVAIIMATWDEMHEVDEHDESVHALPNSLRQDFDMLKVHPDLWGKAADALEGSSAEYVTQAEALAMIRTVVPKRPGVVLGRLWPASSGKDDVGSAGLEGVEQDGLLGKPPRAPEPEPAPEGSTRVDGAWVRQSIEASLENVVPAGGSGAEPSAS